MRVERQPLMSKLLVEEGDEQRARRGLAAPVDPRRQLELAAPRLERDDFAVLDRPAAGRRRG